MCDIHEFLTSEMNTTIYCSWLTYMVLCPDALLGIAAWHYGQAEFLAYNKPLKLIRLELIHNVLLLLADNSHRTCCLRSSSKNYRARVFGSCHATIRRDDSSVRFSAILFDVHGWQSGITSLTVSCDRWTVVPVVPCPFAYFLAAFVLHTANAPPGLWHITAIRTLNLVSTYISQNLLCSQSPVVFWFNEFVYLADHFFCRCNRKYGFDDRRIEAVRYCDARDIVLALAPDVKP